MQSRDNPSARLNSPDLQSDALDLLVWRERFIVVVLRIAAVLGIALLVVTFPTATAGDRILFVGLYIILLAITVLKVPYAWRASMLLFFSSAIGMNAILAWGPWRDGSLFLLLGVTLASLLFDQRIDFIGLGVGVFAVIGIAVLHQNGIYQLTGANAPQVTPADWVGYIVDLALAGVLIVMLINQFKGAVVRAIQKMQNAFSELAVERAQLAEKIREQTEEYETRMSQLHTSVTTARSIAEIQSITDLLESTASLITERFGYYHVGLYILNEQKNIAFLQASSSATGKQIVGHGFQTGPDRRNPFNSVVENNRPVILLDSNQNNFVKDENFPLTRSRMILPMALRGNVIGILDIQSDQPDVFHPQDAEILQLLADLTAISFDNARLINETKSLLVQLDANTSIQTQRAWSKLTSRQKPVYQYTPAGVRPVFAHEKRGDEGGLLVPLILHGQRIGSINLKRKSNEKWSEHERALIEKVAEQVTLALENSRLVDEAQKNALRDQMIANVSTRIRETLDVDAVIRTAATELRRIFDLKEAEITVGSALQNQYRQEA